MYQRFQYLLETVWLRLLTVDSGGFVSCLTMQGQKVFITHFLYVGISRAYTNGLAVELKEDNQTPTTISDFSIKC